VVTSTDVYASSLGGQRSNYEYKDIGIQLTVTPRINPQRFVVMELTQKADQIGTIVEIDGNEVPTILNREFEASIAVPDGGTVVLGGLMSTDVSDTVNKIPILGDIPLIGRYLFSSVTQIEKQRELIVLMTPYVMTNLDEMQGQTEHLYQGTSILQEDWKGSWSDSKLRQIPDPEEE
jgi:type II secretory pathway component GspD/PulD (secretin)